VEEAFADLVTSHSSVDTVVPVATRRWRRSPFATATRTEISATRHWVRKLQPDVCIDPQGVMKSAVVTRLSGARRRIGLARPWRRELLPGLVYSETLPGSTEHPHVVATNIQMVRAFGISPPRELPLPDGGWLRTLWQGRDLPKREKPYVVVAVAAGQTGKVLATPLLAGVCRALAEPRRPVVVVWGPGEREQAQAVVEASGADVELAPATDLVELARLLDAADLVVGADTGPLHLAASLGTPSLSVFLTTNWRRNRPLGRYTAVVSAVSDASVAATGSARARTMREISVEEIVDSAEDLLKTAASNDAE
jgi:lipopolysaccharide heptosyltransferase I